MHSNVNWVVEKLKFQHLNFFRAVYKQMQVQFGTSVGIAHFPFTQIVRKLLKEINIFAP